MANSPSPRLKESKVVERVHYRLRTQFGYSSPMQIPKLDKIVLNIGTGASDKILEQALKDLASISGQKPIVTVAKKSVAEFRVREGMPVGAKVTIRGDAAYHFFDRLVNVALPRQRDFRGLSPHSFDGRGNYALGIKDLEVFHEVEDLSTYRKRGMDIIICTTAQSDSEGLYYLSEIGLPILPPIENRKDFVNRSKAMRITESRRLCVSFETDEDGCLTRAAHPYILSVSVDYPPDKEANVAQILGSGLSRHEIIARLYRLEGELHEHSINLRERTMTVFATSNGSVKPPISRLDVPLVSHSESLGFHLTPSDTSFTDLHFMLWDDAIGLVDEVFLRLENRQDEYAVSSSES